MWTAVLSWLGQLLGGPFIRAALDAYRAKLDKDANADVLRADMAAQAMQIELELARLHQQQRIAQSGHWYAVENLFGYVTLLYYAKVLIWDAALHLGTTDAVRGDVGLWAGLVISFFFGKRTIETALRIWRAK